MLVTRPSPHLEALARLSTPELLQNKECAPTPYLYDVFTFGLVVESIKEFGGVSDVPQNMATPLVEGITAHEISFGV